jgi:hypothetical protein
MSVAPVLMHRGLARGGLLSRDKQRRLPQTSPQGPPGLRSSGAGHDQAMIAKDSCTNTIRNLRQKQSFVIVKQRHLAEPSGSFAIMTWGRSAATPPCAPRARSQCSRDQTTDRDRLVVRPGTLVTRHSRQVLAVCHSISGRNHHRVQFGALHDPNYTQ